MDLKGLQIEIEVGIESFPIPVTWNGSYLLNETHKKIIFLNSMEDNNLVSFETSFIKYFY